MSTTQDTASDRHGHPRHSSRSSKKAHRSTQIRLATSLVALKLAFPDRRVSRVSLWHWAKGHVSPSEMAS